MCLVCFATVKKNCHGVGSNKIKGLRKPHKQTHKPVNMHQNCLIYLTSGSVYKRVQFYKDKYKRKGFIPNFPKVG